MKSCRVLSFFSSTALLVTALAFFLVAMEEISWGQRLLQIEVSELFQRTNLQSEINLHNLLTQARLNHILKVIAVLAFTAVMAGTTIPIIVQNPGSWALILPRATLLPIAALILLFSLPPVASSPELVEELLSVMAFFYALQMHLFLRARGS